MNVNGWPSGVEQDRDWLDIETVILRQRGALEAEIIWRELIPLLDLKGDADTQPRLQRLLKKAGGRP